MAKYSFQIITDSSCDMPEAYLKEHEIACVDLGLQIDGKLYNGEEGIPISAPDFYAKLRGGAMPTTFQVTPEQVKLHIEPFLKEGKDVLVIAFSSGLSGTAHSFQVAAEDLMKKHHGRKVLVVDSLAASMGEGLLLDYAIKKAESGASVEETAAYAESIKLHICHWFTVEDLFHLKRGGRVSAATAMVGTLLNIKPVLHVDDAGHLINMSKAMGRKKSIRALVDKMEELNSIGKDDPVFISHGDCIEDATFLADLVRKRFGEREIMIHYVGPVIGTHSGAGTLALFFMGTQR